MTRIFLVNLILLITANLLVKPLWVFGIDLQVQNIVGASEYGLYAAMLNFTMLPGILLDLGINQFNNSQVAKFPSDAKKFFVENFSVKIFLIVLYFIFTVTAGWIIGYIYERNDLFVLLLMVQVLAGIILFLRTFFSGLHLFKTDTILSISDKLLMILICGYLLYFHKNNFRIEWFVYAQIFCYIISIILCFILLSLWNFEAQI